MDFLLTEEERMFKRQIREFVTKEIEPFSAEWDRRDEFAADSFKKLASQGLTGLTIPEQYGGQGGGVIHFAIAMQEISRACVSTALTLDTHLAVSVRPIYKNGTEEQRQRLVIPAAKGEKICAFALTERGAGSDAAAMETTAKREGDEWVINGAKCFITNGNVADIVLLLATIDKTLKTRGITAFIIEKGTAGFSIGKIEKKMGIRGTSNAELFLDNCRIPMTNQLGEAGRGFPLALAALDEARVGIACQAAGLAEGALDASITYSKERQQFGQPVAEFQAIQWMLADMATSIDAAWLLAYRAARLADAGQRFTKEAAQAKLFASEMAVEVTRQAIQIHGGYGYMRDLPLERFYRDAKITEIYEGTSEMQRLVISRGLLA